MEGKENIVMGMMVLGHKTNDKFGEDPVYTVKLRSADKKTKLSLELPDLGRAIFHEFPKGSVFEIVIKAPSQITLDKFQDDLDEDDED